MHLCGQRISHLPDDLMPEEFPLVVFFMYAPVDRDDRRRSV